MAGRPSAYKPEFCEIARKAAEVGMTDPEIAELLEVHTATLYRWKTAHPEFCESLKSGKELSDERVERALFQRAIGYRQKAVKIFMPSGAEQPVYAEYEEAVTPDTTAAIFWLKNRRPDQWREKSIQEVTGKDGGAIQTEDVGDGRDIARRVAMLLAKAVHAGAE